MAKAPKALGKVIDLSDSWGYKSTVVGYCHSPRYEIHRIDNNDGGYYYKAYAKMGSGGLATHRNTLNQAIEVAKNYISGVGGKTEKLWTLPLDDNHSV